MKGIKNEWLKPNEGLRGTNDLGNQLTIHQGFNKLLSSRFDNNIIVVVVTYRYDKEHDFSTRIFYAKKT